MSCRGGLFAVVLLFGCTEGEAEPEPASRNTLVLELGGSNASLQGALHAIDARHAPPPRAEPALPREQPAPLREEPAPPVAVPPAVEERWVELAEGQTISDIAREQLGSSRRFGEILELNGWDEERARKLRIGTRVRLPAR